MRSIANRRKWVQFPSQPVKVGPVKVGRSKGRDQGEEKKGRKEDAKKKTRRSSTSGR